MTLVAAQDAVSLGGKHVLRSNFADWVGEEPRDYRESSVVEGSQSSAINKYAISWEHAA